MSKLSSLLSVEKALYISRIFFQKGIFSDNFSVIVVIIIEFLCRVYKCKYVLFGKNTFNTFSEKKYVFYFSDRPFKTLLKVLLLLLW